MGTISVGLLVISATVLAGTSAFGQAALPKSISACAAIDDDAKRLACYDAAVSTVDAQVAKATEARKIAAVARAKAEAEKAESDRLVALAAADKAKVDNFGVATVAKEDRPASVTTKSELESLEAAVTSVFYTADKKLILALDNGQIWRQTDSSSSPLVRAGDKVEVKKGILGGFRMKLLRHKRMLDVLRFR
jgi:hypothetical protein